MKITRLLILFVIAGCQGEGVTRPPPTDVRVFNAAPNVENIIFRREEDTNNPIPLGYGGGAHVRWDSGPYDLNLDYSKIGVGLVRAFSFAETLSPEIDYTFVAVSTGGEPEVLTFRTDARPDDAPNTRVTLIHAFNGLGSLDVYMEAPGTVLAGAVPRGTIGFASDALTFEAPAGTYRIYLTTPGDPSDVVFESSNETLVEQGGDRENVYVISDPAGRGSAQIVVSRVGSTTFRLGQIGLQSSLRVVHGISDRLERDIYIDDTTSPALFPAQPFAVFSPYADVALGAHTLIVTPVGNPGTEEFSSDPFSPTSGGLYTVLVSQNADDEIAMTPIAEDKRSIVGQATLRVLDGAGLFGVVNVYLEEPGTDTTNLSPQLQMFPPGATPRTPLVPNDYEITVRDPNTSAVLAGPEPVTLEDGGVYGVLIVNGAGGSTVDLVLFDDFVP